MDLGLQGKGVIVLASSAGLGKGIACEFAREQAKVMLFSSNEEKLIAAQQEIEAETGNRPSYIVGDMTKAEDIKRVVAVAAEKFGNIYALVNNSGGPKAGNFDAFDDDIWQQAYDLTLLSYIRAVREVLPYMRKAGVGRIVCSTSSSVKTALDNLILSNTFRCGVVGLAKSLSQELGKDNILVNVIGPGRIRTERIDVLDQFRAEKTGKTIEEMQAAHLKNIPLGRYGDPAEYGKLAAFLCSEANTYITGQTMLADGGQVKAI